jgi:hypothetical protein
MNLLVKGERVIGCAQGRGNEETQYFAKRWPLYTLQNISSENFSRQSQSISVPLGNLRNLDCDSMKNSDGPEPKELQTLSFLMWDNAGLDFASHSCTF